MSHRYRYVLVAILCYAIGFFTKELISVNQGFLDRDLCRAAYSGDAESVKWLLKQGADPNARVMGGKLHAIYYAFEPNRGAMTIPPLVSAAMSGNLETVKVLIAAGARTETTTWSLNNPLYYARRYPDVAQCLLDAGYLPFGHWKDGEQLHAQGEFEKKLQEETAKYMRNCGYIVSPGTAEGG